MRFDDRRVDDRRTDAIHPDAQFGVLDGGNLGHIDDGRLARRIAALSGATVDSGNRRRVDDRIVVHFHRVRLRRLLLAKLQDFVLHAQEHASRVDVHRQIELVDRPVLHSAHANFSKHAGVVECTVESAELRYGMLDHQKDGLLVRHVALDAGSSAAVLNDRVSRLLGRLLIDVGAHNQVIQQSETQRRSLSDATASTSDQHDGSRHRL